MAKLNPFVAIGIKIVATEQRADNTVRDAVLACFAYSPADLANVTIGIKQAYKKRLQAMEEEVGILAIGDSKASKGTIYNRQSEKLAVMEAFTLAHLWETSERTAFKALLDEGGYHNMVQVCRAVVRGDPVQKTKAVSANLKLKSYLKAVNNTTDRAALIELRTAIDARIAMLKPKVETVSLSAKRAERVAQAQASNAALEAVNPQLQATG
jgi:hypothetical protein